MSRSLCVLILVLLGGCSQRPAESLRKDGNFLYEHGDYAKAAQKYAEITERYPGDWEAHYRLGLCQLELDELSAARRELEVAHTSRPGDPDVVDALAETMFLQGQEAQLYTFVKQQAESAQTVRAWLRQGRYAARLGDADSAQTAFETAIVLDNGKTVDPYLQASKFAEDLGDMDQALRRLRQAYAIEPTDPRVIKRLRELGEIPGPTIGLPPGK
ncbi:MAG: tetratricopeptide repeat protein [Planctomycetota bacterium]|jgi:tetratricopeptide (TPR) repeat protein